LCQDDTNVRLARAWRPDKKRARRNLSPKTLVLLRVLQKLDDLLEFLFGFVNARNVLEGDSTMTLC